MWLPLFTAKMWRPAFGPVYRRPVNSPSWGGRVVALRDTGGNSWGEAGNDRPAAENGPTSSGDIRNVAVGRWPALEHNSQPTGKKETYDASRH